ncbi:MAG: endo-1,4-beta-xylanase, partial [Prevotella sp.]|nr:endo-1,4-beta-xylanase [Prevotella sp.]
MFTKSFRKALLLSAAFVATSAYAQLSTNPDKFLGNITTAGQVNYNGVEFASLWNQITPENESKWSSVQGDRSKYNWGGCDNCVNYAKNNKFPFKFHCLIWGAQYPDWINSLTIYERKKAIVDWMTNIKTKYSKLDMIDVVNEAISGHQPNTPVFIQALGGEGQTGYDWIVKAFEMAHERWPEAILIYNDFNTFQWNTDQYIDLVTKLRDAGAPIDAYGCQSHDLTDCNITTFKNSMNKIQNALKMPMYISEYDLGTYDDNHQKNQMSQQFPVMWEADYCAGVTLWGYVYGHTWTDDGNSGLIKNGVDRPAMTWLRSYMQTDAAKNAKSPYPNMKKEISLYIKPAQYKAPIGEPCDITVNATMHNGSTIEKVELYVNNTLVSTMTEAPYVYPYTPVNTNKVNLKAIVYTSNGKTFERLGGMYGSKYAQGPYEGAPLEIPGILEAENFNKGGESISFHTSRTSAST